MRITTAVAAATIALTAACGSPSGSTSEDTIPLGVIIDKTGVFASLGVPALNGVRLAIDEINDAGGINGRKIDLLVQDGTSDPAVAAAAARTLSSKVQVAFGTAAGSGCRAVQPILDAAKVLQYCLSPQQFTLTPLFFWALAPVSGYVPATMPWLKAKGYHRIAVIGQNDSTGDGYLSVFSAIAKSDPVNYQIVDTERFDSGATNLETQMTKIRDARPDVIVSGTSGDNVVPVVRAINSLGMTQPVWVGTGSATINSLSPLANDLPSGGLFANAYWADIPGQVPGSVPYAGKVTSFAQAYSAKYKQQPVAEAAGSYDAATQIIDALKSKATTGTQIAAYLQENHFTGVLGDYTFSPTVHQGAALPPVMMTYQGTQGFKLAFSGS
ncbi:ABC transporter substrate-binding protein [Amycolatopsis pigmentata]|uniref:ABC transporter substrate-binding protein n=1 Tax=Amycolatopsis pigmentata TaxID=450801 RepID=A0ABW5FNE6_9PSEU